MIRTLLCLGVSFALGALAFSGEEDEDTLRTQVRALTTELQRRSAAQRGPQLELRFHQTLRYRPNRMDERPRSLNLAGAFRAPEPAEYDVEPISSFEMDGTVQLIRETVEPASWESMEGVDLWSANAGLMIRHLPRAHEKVARLLADLRRSEQRELEVEIRAIRVGDRDLVLEGAEIERIAQSEPLDSIRFRCFSGPFTLRQAGAEVRYLGDYDVQIAEAATIGRPRPKRVFDGFSVAVRTLLDDTAGGVRMELRLDRNDVRRPVRRADSEHGPLELPSMEVTRLRTAFWAPLAKWAIAGGSADCLFLVRVDRSRRP